jgi:hypothetical protein
MTFSNTRRYCDDIAEWLTRLENYGNVTDIKFEKNGLSVAVFARIEHNVSRVEITMDTRAISVEEAGAISARAVARAVGKL